MPRPGPRPYECVRRAWHSDRHQPMRGSLIQEIFRIANEVHSTATKKNKEWQEKLPIVVLKAEEIMYSKANSEVEYMDLKTLWDRTNDAINTIIRLDESTETGDLLQPCIEAALNLGCIPRRASRSQSNITASYYLNPRNQNPDNLFADAMHDAIKAAQSTGLHCALKYSNFGATMVGNLTSYAHKPQDFVCHSNDCQNDEVAFNKLRCTKVSDPLPSDNKSATSASYPCSGLWSVFPLHYGDSVELKSVFGILTKSNYPSSLEPEKSLKPQTTVRVASNLYGIRSTPIKIHKTDCDDGIGSSQEFECDLSLRLGSPSSASPVVDAENKLNDGMQPRENNFPYYPWVNEDNPSHPCSSKLSDCADIISSTKKRKVVVCHNSNNQALC